MSGIEIILLLNGTMLIVNTTVLLAISHSTIRGVKDDANRP